MFVLFLPLVLDDGGGLAPPSAGSLFQIIPSFLSRVMCGTSQLANWLFLGVWVAVPVLSPLRKGGAKQIQHFVV